MANRKKTAPAISIEISPGEACDRVEILFLKQRMLRDPEKRTRVTTEIHKQRLANQLLYVRPGQPAPPNGVIELQEELSVLHRQLWDVENEVRKCEADKDFGPFFIRAARRVYKLNDRRSQIKAKIDEAYGYAPEAKEYQSYGQEEENPGPASSGCPHAGG
jgi:hypothetical protein